MCQINFLTHFMSAPLNSGGMSRFCSTNDCFVNPSDIFFRGAIPRRDNNILHIAIARRLNDEKVGPVKIAGQENVSCVYPFFFFSPHIRNGVIRPRRIPKGNYGLVTTVGTTFYAITRLCFTAGALTHLPGLMCATCVSLYYAETSLFDNVVTEHYERRRVFAGKTRARHRYHPLLHRKRDKAARKSQITERTNSCSVSHAHGMHHAQA